MTPAEEWAGRQYPGMEDPLRGLLLDHLLGRVRRALDGMARSRAPAEARRRELEQVLEGLMEMRKEKCLRPGHFRHLHRLRFHFRHGFHHHHSRYRWRHHHFHHRKPEHKCC